MRVLVDGRPHPVLLMAAPSVAVVIAEVDGILEHQGRAIQKVAIDGDTWPLEELADSIADMSVDEIALVEIFTEDLRVLVERSLTEIDSVIGELPTACHTLAALLNSPDRGAALESYAEFEEVWYELLERHRQVLSVLKLKPSAVSVGGMSLARWDDKVLLLVQQGAELAMSGDAPSLADLLSHDIAAFAEQEAEIIESLRKLATSDSPRHS